VPPIESRGRRRTPPHTPPRVPGGGPRGGSPPPGGAPPPRSSPAASAAQAWPEPGRQGPRRLVSRRSSRLRHSARDGGSRARPPRRSSAGVPTPLCEANPRDLDALRGVPLSPLEVYTHRPVRHMLTTVVASAALFGWRTLGRGQKEEVEASRFRDIYLPPGRDTDPLSPLSSAVHRAETSRARRSPRGRRRDGNPAGTCTPAGTGLFATGAGTATDTPRDAASSCIYRSSSVMTISDAPVERGSAGHRLEGSSPVTPPAPPASRDPRAHPLPAVSPSGPTRPRMPGRPSYRPSRPSAGAT